MCSFFSENRQKFFLENPNKRQEYEYQFSEFSKTVTADV